MKILERRVSVEDSWVSLTISQVDFAFFFGILSFSVLNIVFIALLAVSATATRCFASLVSDSLTCRAR